MNRTWKGAIVTDTTLALGRSGDSEAFRELTDPYRGELHLHCYRILGSLTDADDLLQETMLAAWRGLDAFEGRSSLRAWLYRIATNRCLNALREGRRRIPTEPIPPFTPPEPTRRDEVTWLQPYPDALQVSDVSPGPETRYHGREAVELAFIAALQRLPPRQTATLVLRDVLGYRTAEVADMLDTTETAIKGTLQRARATLDKHRDNRAPTQPGSVEGRDLVRRFADAFTADDIDGVVALLTDKAWLAMPPAPHAYHGPDAIAAFLHASATWRARRRFHLTPTIANGQPAYGWYFYGSGVGLIVLTTARDKITRITHFLDSELLPRFGLPTKLALPPHDL